MKAKTRGKKPEDRVENMSMVREKDPNKDIKEMLKEQPEGVEVSCPGDCEPTCSWCRRQADIAAQNEILENGY